jgi:hypothetical protein
MQIFNSIFKNIVSDVPTIIFGCDFSSARILFNLFSKLRNAFVVVGRSTSRRGVPHFQIATKKRVQSEEKCTETSSHAREIRQGNFASFQMKSWAE